MNRLVSIAFYGIFFNVAHAADEVFAPTSNYRYEIKDQGNGKTKVILVEKRDDATTGELFTSTKEFDPKKIALRVDQLNTVLIFDANQFRFQTHFFYVSSAY